MDTTAFNHTLAETLGREFDVFKAMSPRDLYWESIGAQKRFRDLDALKAYGNGLLHSFYVHACHWQANIEALTDRVDSFIVYLSSITPSVLWEIDTPKAKGRAADTTDESGWALAVYAGLQKALLDRGHRRRRRPRPQRLRWRGSSQRRGRAASCGRANVVSPKSGGHRGAGTASRERGRRRGRPQRFTPTRARISMDRFRSVPRSPE